MHFGATLRLLRLDSGLSLRDLARRLGVSGTYLSRVENGLDAPPTLVRLKAIAEELGVPDKLLSSVAHEAAPLIVDYARESPAAARLFLEIAQRQLDAGEIEQVRQFVRARFPLRHEACSQEDGLSSLLSVDRVVVKMTCSGIEDVLDVAAGRLEGGLLARGGSLGPLLRAREREVSSAIGGGMLVPGLHVDDIEPCAAVVTLARPLDDETPDGVPLRVVAVLAAPRGSAARRIGLLHLARWAGRGLADRLVAAPTPAAVLTCIRDFE